MSEDDSFSNDSSTHSISSFELLADHEEDRKKKCHLIYYTSVVASLHTRFFLQVLSYLINALQLMKKRKLKRQRKANVHCDQASVLRFIHSWDDDMFKHQIQLSREDFALLENLILDHKIQKGYDYEKHIKYASLSSGSAITLELRLYITLHLCSGAQYLYMIWYAVSLDSIPEIFWSTICEIDEAIDNIIFLLIHWV
jgi:hypothetical protein